MPLAGLIQAHRKSIGQFLADPKAALLYLEAAPEAEAVAAKIVASVEAEPSADVIVLAHSGPFADAASFYRLAAESILENIAENLDALKEEGVEIPKIAPLDESYQKGKVPIEVLFADFAERVSRAIRRSIGSQLVVLLRAEDVADQQAFAASAQLLGSVGNCEGVKYIAMIGPDQATLPTAPPPQRLNVVSFKEEKSNATPSLQSFLSTWSRRVLVMMCSKASHGHVLGGLQGARLKLGAPKADAWIDLTGGTMTAALRGAIESLRTQASMRGLRLDPPDPNFDPVDGFADLSEQYARQWMPDHGPLLVTLNLTSLGPDAVTKVGGKLALALNRAACSPRVRYLLLDDSAGGIFPILQEAPRKVTRLSVAIQSKDVEDGIKAKLADPALPPMDRITYLEAAAATASAHGEHQVALNLHNDALNVCGTLGAKGKTASVMVWLGIGNSYYVARNWPYAENCYAKALELAMAENLDAVSAQATLSVGNAQLCAGKNREAGQCYTIAAGWYDKLGSPLFACNVLTWLGESQRRANNLPDAEQTWSSTLARYREFGPDLRDPAVEGMKQVLARLARLQEQRRNAAGAAKYRSELKTLGASEVIVPEQP